MSPVCSDSADLVLRFATWLNFYSAVQPCIRPATSKSRYLWLCMSLNHSILFLHHVLSPYSPIYKPSCSKCQVLWGFSQLVTYHRKERTTTLLSQEMNLNQWVRKPSQKFWILLPDWSTRLMLLSQETISFVATFFKVNTGGKSEKCEIQSNCRSFEFCFLIGPHGWCSCNQKL